MTRLTGLLQATWRGIPFFVESEGITEGGRRVILHDYPNSGNRYVEDLGELPKQFRLSAFVSGPDFVDRANQLERALSEAGPGRLTLPTFGAATLYAMPYRIDASHQSVGEIKFDLAFTVGQSVSGPERATATIETVYAAGDASRTAISSELSDSWEAPPDIAGSEVAQFDLSGIVSAFDVFSTAVDNITEFTNSCAEIVSNVVGLIKDPASLASALVGGFFQTLSEGLDAGRGLESLLTLSAYDIGSQPECPVRGGTVDGAYWPETTISRIARNANRRMLSDTVQLCSMVSAYEQAAAKIYGTDTEIDQTRSAIEAVHEDIMRVNTVWVPEVRRAVETLRIAALSVMDQKEQTTFTVTEITQRTPAPVFILAYDLYGSTDKALTIRALNPDQASDRMSGELTVVQA